MSYLRHTKAMFVEALQQTFDGDYDVADWRNLLVSIEYPVDQQAYPSIWVNYADDDPLVIAGIGHTEYTAGSGSNLIPHTRWRFTGTVSFTVVAMTSNERDRLYDELVRVIAFGKENTATARFRQLIESNDLIAANVNFDEVTTTATVAAPGTPWGTDEVMYETTVNLDVIGEFIPDASTGELIPLSGFVFTEVEALPSGDGGPASFPDVDTEEGPTGWH